MKLQLALLTTLTMLSATAAERYPLSQPSVPADIQESPFVETAPQVTPTEEEKKTGAFLFTRPMTDPIFPQTRPLPFEKTAALEGFAARGELETLNFAIYPLRKLNEVRVKVGEFTNGDAKMPETAITPELVTYWNIKYPAYLSFSHYRRMPEYVEPVTRFDAPAKEPQRIFVTFRVPKDAAAGVYTGSVTVTSPDLAAPLTLPVKLEVLPFELKQDPAKKYTAYHAVIRREPDWTKRKNVEWLNRAALNEYKAMADCGMNTAPNVYLAFGTRNGVNRLEMPYFDEALALMKEAGIKPPVPVVGCGIQHLYKKMTGQTMAKHILTPVPVPEELYTELDRMVKEFKQESIDRKWPEMVFCPLDEISPESAEVGKRVYKIFHDNGLKTFATKDPVGDSSAAAIAPYVDIWSSQTYSVPYEKVIADRRHQYWSYPNHNAYEFKDPLAMCKGGRMTYGFGNWRSGYDALMPWVWRSTNSNHLDPKRDAGGNRMENNAIPTLTTYWIAFREGVDDARYLYTLQDAVVKRESSTDPETVRLVKEAKALLQRIWDEIPVQPKYLRDGMWPSAEFDARRRQLAEMIVKLDACPVSDANAVSPSVLPNPGVTPLPENEFTRLYDQAVRNGNLEVLDLAKDRFAGWATRTAETTLDVTGNPAVLQMKIKVDHASDGEGTGGQYKVGWPRMYREFKRPGLDLAGYEFFLLKLKITSNRDEVADDRTPLYLSVNSYEKYSKDYYILDYAEQNRELTILYPVSELLAIAPASAFKVIRTLQLGISEAKYLDKTELDLAISSIGFIRFRKPMLKTVEAPKVALLPAKSLPFHTLMLGAAQSGKCRLTATLEQNGKAVRSEVVAIAPEVGAALPLDGVTPGDYTFRLTVTDEAGKTVSEYAAPLQLHRQTAKLR